MWERMLLRLRFRFREATGRRPPRVVFLHIPKSGGSTLNRHFKWNIGNGRSGRLASLDSMTGCDAAAIARAQRARFVSGHFGWKSLKAVDRDAFRFTVLRDPYERLKSLYRFSRSRPPSLHPVFERVFEAARREPFEAFCLSEEPDVRALVDNAQARALAGDFYPFVSGDSDAIGVSARRHLDALDLVLDQADLDAGMPLLALRTDTRLTNEQLWLNRTPEVRVGAMIDRHAFIRDRRLFARIAQDFELYEHFRLRTFDARARREAARRVGAYVRSASLILAL